VYEVPDHHRRRAVVTGASSGLGREVARRLAGAGAEVVLAVRSLERGERAAESIRASHPDARLEVRLVDLADLAAVEAFCAALLADPRPLHLLANNAGIMRPRRRAETVDHLELQFATNVVGPYLLTARLMARLADSGGARVGWMASNSSVVGRLDFDDLQARSRYRPFRAYAQSKLADLVVALWMARRAERAGWPLVSVAAHPGFVRTNLFSAGASVGRPSARHSWLESRWLPSQEVADGAEPLLYALTSPDARNGAYYGPCGPFGLVGPTAPARVPRRASAVADGDRLVDALAALTGAEMTL
jgi:NAD(P)-dependent dehydrogenase (short-subunit alcohol dehydrogenase family)